MLMMIVPPICDHIVMVKGALFSFMIVGDLLAGRHSSGGASQVRVVKGRRCFVGLFKGGGVNLFLFDNFTN